MRTLLAIAGLVTLAGAWIGPLPQLSHEAFFGHMIMHMLNVAVAAPLLSFAIAGSRWDPVDKAPLLFAPIPASVVELFVVWAWHAPLPHHIARHSLGGLVAEQGMFLMAGIWVWLSAFGGQRDQQGLLSGARSGAGVVGLLLTSMHMTLLGALLALAPRPLYEHHEGFAGMTPLQDQHLGGAVMLVGGGIAYLSGGLWLSYELIRQKTTVDKEVKTT